jgi:hypothetical protein
MNLSWSRRKTSKKFMSWRIHKPASSECEMRERSRDGARLSHHIVHSSMAFIAHFLAGRMAWVLFGSAGTLRTCRMYSHIIP